MGKVTDKCILCSRYLVEDKENHNDSAGGFVNGNSIYSIYHCPVCKKYAIALSVDSQYFPNNITSEERTRLSGYFREYWEISDIMQKGFIEHLDDIMLNEVNIIKLLSSNEIPRKEHIERKFYKLLKYLKSKSSYYGQLIALNENDDYPLAYAQNNVEFIYIIKHLAEEKLIHIHQDSANQKLVYITYRGLKTLQEINTDSKQIFVALSFNSELKSILEEDFFINEIKQSTGYDLITIDKKAHNNKICDEIIAEINRSRAIIADFTDNNSGAYYEAGYAQGIGIDVIFICKDSINENANSDEKGNKERLIDRVHFDTRQFSHILWKDNEDLRNQLINRINKTLGKPKQ